jgi:hypothetical protein
LALSVWLQESVPKVPLGEIHCKGPSFDGRHGKPHHQSANDGEPSYAMEPTEACFVVDLDLGLSDAVGSHVDSLAQNFDDMFMDYNE